MKTKIICEPYPHKKAPLNVKNFVFYSVWHPAPGRWADWWVISRVDEEKTDLYPCRVFIVGRGMVMGVGVQHQWCQLYLIFNLVILSFKISS